MPGAFLVGYRFLCPKCNTFDVGTKVIFADTAENASHALHDVPISCSSCSPDVQIETVATTFVFPATTEEIQLNWKAAFPDSR